MKRLAAALALLAAPAWAEQVVNLVTADFTVARDAATGLCVATDQVLSARKEGIEVTILLDAHGNAELVLAPDGADHSARLYQTVAFAFEDSLVITAKARLLEGRYLIALQEDGQPTDLWIALRRRAFAVVALPRKPEDRFGIDLRTMPDTFAALTACQKDAAQ
ncbi:hypothetical protein [Thalassovita sp.]|uniref:hypothetical protein n=1 Tax=Thalassovita sp. TaxID=1979401 RepID=UPI0029DE7A78|nr:hypothetical protein [Thalassovita sp.]